MSISHAIAEKYVRTRGKIRAKQYSYTQTMSTYLTHTTLRTTWGLIGHKGLSDKTLCDVRRPTDATRQWRELKREGTFDNGFLSHLSEPYDLLFPSKESRIRSKHVSPHLCLRDLPSGSFRRLRPNLYVLTPAMNFVQMGEVLTMTQLAAYGLELCGGYALAPGTKRGFVDRPPLTTVEELQEILQVGPRLRGVRKAREALTWVLPGSRSPRETDLDLLLCLPSMRGGYSIPQAELNRAVPLSYEASRFVGVPVLHPDLCWFEQRTIAEYDSDGTHLEEGQVIRDVDRKDAFAADGWNVITFTNARLKKAEVFDRIVREQLAPLLCCVPSAPTPEFLAARKQLRSELLAFNPYLPTKANDRGRLALP